MNTNHEHGSITDITMIYTLFCYIFCYMWQFWQLTVWLLNFMWQAKVPYTLTRGTVVHLFQLTFTFWGRHLAIYIHRRNHQVRFLFLSKLKSTPKCFIAVKYEPTSHTVKVGSLPYPAFIPQGVCFILNTSVAIHLEYIPVLKPMMYCTVLN